MRKNVPRHHAVDHVEVQKPVVVEVAEAARPAPAGGVYTEVISDVLKPAFCAALKDVLLSLRVAVKLPVVAPLHQRHPGGERSIIGKVGFHIGGEELGGAVVVDVARVEAHGVAGGGGERRSFKPALVRIHVNVVGYLEVVTDEDVRFAVLVHVKKRERQGLGGLGEPCRDETVWRVLINNDARARGEEKRIFKFLLEQRVI